MNSISINKKKIYCDPNAYPEFKHDEYNNLKLYPIIGNLERYAGLLNDLSDLFPSPSIKIIGIKHSSIIILNIFECFHKIYIQSDKQMEYLQQNIKEHHLESKVCIGVNQTLPFTSILFALEPFKISNMDKYPVIFCHQECILDGMISEFKKFHLTKTEYDLYIHKSFEEKFRNEFYYYFDEQLNLNYDNLIHLCIMVKNGGKEFEEMLEKNLPIIDRYTILDTGSTDDTVENAKRILKAKRGKIFEEPFINFRESRNRCLDLAGKRCKYNLMLDDTYVIEGNLREFLETIRSDQFADSYSLLIKSGDTEYYSNRITKSANHLRYIFILHEVIQQKDNVNVVVPFKQSWIYDIRSPVMEDRTNSRKEYDLKCLFQMIEEDPDEPRHYYYVAQTYNCLENREKAAEYFKKRAFHPKTGFDQEKVDALFEMTRLYNFHLNRPWDECKKYYELCHEWDSERPDASYFLGIHYYLENNYDKAYFYFKRGFEIGFPIHRQYSLKPTLSFHFLPKFLAKISYMKKDFKTGFECCELFLKHNKPGDDSYQEIVDWYAIYRLLVSRQEPISNPKILDQKIFCFIAPGGFKKWKGSSILYDGVGGSETYIIEIARYLKKHSNYEIIVFCDCDDEEIFEGVKYLRLERALTELSTYQIEHCMISRFSEYIPLAIHSHVKNIHLVVHDLTTSGMIIPMHEKLKNIFCLSEWHREYFIKIFPTLKHITKSFHYGIDFKVFQLSKPISKIKNSFIFSSFPNRGLIVVLQMWNRIKSRYPDAVLNIFCDLENKWVNDNYPDEMKEIKRILNVEFKDDPSVVNHGWVSKKRLARKWRKSEIWFYPCKFHETFCLTALEAALSKTLAITNKIGALEDTVGDRGVCVPGSMDDVLTLKWQDKAFDVICEYLDNPSKRELYLKRNYEWALKHSWEHRAKNLLKLLQPNLIDRMVETEIPLSIKNVGMFFAYENDFISNYLIENGDWESEYNSVFDKYLNKSSVVVDVGAFIGTNTVKMANRAKKVYSFEPVNQTFQLLKRNIEKNKLNNVILHNTALGKTESTIDGFWYPMEEYNEKNYGAMRVGKDNKLMNHFLEQKTQVKKLDDMIREKIDLIKIDVEGYENEVLEGAFKLIEKYRPIILIENHSNDKFSKLLELDYDRIDLVCKKDKNCLFVPRLRAAKIQLELNYADMYNWTNDLPKNTKVIFENVLKDIKNSAKNVLEIGTFAGVSLISILQILTNAKGYAIDQWKSYKENFNGEAVDSLKNIEKNNIENVFDENIQKAGMVQRVEKFKGDSTKVLLEMIKDEKLKFDFIYIDGSHQCPDVYLDCVLSWELLNKDGVMAMDDYLYKKDQNDWNIPYHGINHFLQKYKGLYFEINIGYRVFIKKLVK
jgi:FkbM family methyltransferase